MSNLWLSFPPSVGQEPDATPKLILDRTLIMEFTDIETNVYGDLDHAAITRDSSTDAWFVYDYDATCDSTTAVAYYGYRYYNPELGRWVSRDPIGEEGGLNMYAFVGNGGVNRFDLLGMAWYDYIPIISTIRQRWSLYITQRAPGTRIEHYSAAQVSYEDCCLDAGVAETLCERQINRMQVDLAGDRASAVLISSGASYATAALTAFAPPIGWVISLLGIVDGGMSLSDHYEYTRRVNNASRRARDRFCDCGPLLRRAR